MVSKNRFTLFSLLFIAFYSCADKQEHHNDNDEQNFGSIEDNSKINRLETKDDRTSEAATIDNNNFWEYKSLLDSLISEEEFQHAYKLSLKFDSSKISKENRLTFYLDYYFVLYRNKKFDRAIQVLREIYVANPLDEISSESNLYMYYYWASRIKLDGLECDSAKYFYKSLKDLSEENPKVFKEHARSEIPRFGAFISKVCK
jgi:hypothetical protein